MSRVPRAMRPDLRSAPFSMTTFTITKERGVMFSTSRGGFASTWWFLLMGNSCGIVMVSAIRLRRIPQSMSYRPYQEDPLHNEQSMLCSHEEGFVYARQGSVKV